MEDNIIKANDIFSGFQNILDNFSKCKIVKLLITTVVCFLIFFWFYNELITSGILCREERMS